MENLSGMQFGKWTVIERAFDGKSKGSRWLCKCECGTVKSVFERYLRKGSSKSCGCAQKKNWVGKRSGKLVVESVSERDGKKVLHCVCDCGNKTTISASSLYQTNSCGCSRYIDCVGDKYGQLTVRQMLPNYKGDGVTYVSCDCDCGRTGYITRLAGVRSGNTSSCGCIHSPDLTGKRFGRLVVVSQVDSSTPQRRWSCRCDCGQEIVAISHHLTSGHIKSCGCLRSERYSYSETLVRTVLDESGYQYIPEHSFDDCIGDKGYRLRFDFYIPSINLAIECDGEQHYKPVDYFGGVEKYNTQKRNDAIKDRYCSSKNICLLRLPYTYTDSQKTDAVRLSILNCKNPVTTTA